MDARQAIVISLANYGSMWFLLGVSLTANTFFLFHLIFGRSQTRGPSNLPHTGSDLQQSKAEVDGR